MICDIDRKLPHITSQKQELAIAVPTLIESDTRSYREIPSQISSLTIQQP
ncbi:hypothetical protein APA_1968 [Pseudanabaena sp. lw0831]|nr:hypothetical protein APA_1968 [Pseudanabaena sp. lw0831]